MKKPAYFSGLVFTSLALLCFGDCAANCASVILRAVQVFLGRWVKDADAVSMRLILELVLAFAIVLHGFLLRGKN